MQFTFDDAAKLAQILFYAIIATITILTFRRAKFTLLSPINTEYHKKVIDRLDRLSQQLLDEFDSKSDDYWALHQPVEDVVNKIIEEFNSNKEAILEAGEFIGVPGHADYERLSAFVQRVKSDPFIPLSIRDEVTDLLEVRANTIHEIHFVEVAAYMQQLASGTRRPDEWDGSRVHNTINEQLYQKGCGISQIEAEVHQIRNAIQRYLDQFNPLR